MKKNLEIGNDSQILTAVVGLIDQARNRVATTVNQELTLLYWNIGKKINDDILKNNRADYGKSIVYDLSISLTKLYGKGFSKRNLHGFVKLHSVFQDVTIVQTLSAQLSWSHLYSKLIFLKA